MVILSLGEIVFDIFADGEKLPGGAPLNFAYYCNFFPGNEAYLVSAVGNDTLGDELLSEVAKLHLSAKYITQNERPTGTVRISHSGNQENAYEIAQNTAFDSIQLNHIHQQADLIYFGTLALRSPHNRQQWRHFLDRQKAFVAVDLNFRQPFFSREIIMFCLQRCNLLKVNEAEWKIMTMELDLNLTPEEFIQKFGLEYLVITKGAQGAELITSREKIFTPAVKTQVCDTTGCGDSFVAVLCHELLHHQTPAIAMQKAAAVAAKVAARKGALVSYDVLRN